MHMDVRTMKHAAKLAEWGEKVQICRSSGMTVKEWCKQNHVYYAWIDTITRSVGKLKEDVTYAQNQKE